MQELIFLWEELGDLYEVLQNKDKLCENDNIKLNLNKISQPSPPKRIYIMGP